MDDILNYRSIPPAPQFQPMIVTRAGVKPRRSRVLDYVKTDKRFLLELRFNRDIDLALFERLILNSPLRCAEYAAAKGADPRIFLIDSRISNEAMIDQVWKWANEELPRVQAAVAIECPEYQPAICLAVVDLNYPQGGIATTPPPVTVKMLQADRFPELDRILQSNGDFLDSYLAKCAADDDFAEAMMYCGRALGVPHANEWANLHRAYEVIADHFGGHEGIVRQLKGCSKNELERFKRTVNHQEAIGAYSRHARMRCAPPPKPMDFITAVKLVLQIMAVWMRCGV
jgi:hypothetical protein